MPGDDELRFEHVFEASPQAVFDAYIHMHDENRRDWIEASDIDLRPGGRWSIVFHPPGLPAFREDRTFTEFDPPARVAYTTAHSFEDGDSFETRMLMTFEGVDGGTHMTLVQSGFPTEERRDEFAGGWSGVFDEIEAVIGERASR
jgi:uncharacterized protein YndB with AHSA1/START domain